MIIIKNKDEIEIMKKAGHIVYETHQYLKPFIKPGISTKELDTLAEQFIISKGAIPSCKGYEGYPACLCTSINEEIVHGIPSDKKVLQEGDIISIDICACYNGYHGDSAWTYPVGKINHDKEYLLHHTEKALYIGLNEIKNGVPLGNISARIEQYAKKHKLGVVKELVGHGVGKNLHEEPDVPNYGKYNTGIILKTGMTLAVEPMLNLGTSKIYILDDDWTIITRDGKPSAHFEHTIVVRDEGYEILTGE